MSKGNTFENDWLKLIFNGTPIANLADNAASSPLTFLYLSLHTADPGEGGNQATSECAYTGYARVAVARDGTGFVVTGNSVSPAADQAFPPCTAGTESATYLVIGTAPTGTGKLLYSGPISPTISIAPGVTPIINAASAASED